MYVCVRLNVCGGGGGGTYVYARTYQYYATEKRKGELKPAEPEGAFRQVMKKKKEAQAET